MQATDTPYKGVDNPLSNLIEGLKNYGYEIVSPIGTIESRIDPEAVDILKPVNPVQKSLLGFKWQESQSAQYLGNLRFYNKEGEPNKNWILEVYGTENVQNLTEVVEKLSKPYGINLEVKLGSGPTRVVTYLQTYPSNLLDMVPS